MSIIQTEWHTLFQHKSPYLLLFQLNILRYQFDECLVSHIYSKRREKACTSLDLWKTQPKQRLEKWSTNPVLILILCNTELLRVLLLCNVRVPVVVETQLTSISAPYILIFCNSSLGFGWHLTVSELSHLTIPSDVSDFQ